MIKGLVSCIIPTYKRSDTLIRAVDSVLKQTHKKIEVIIVDDNNPDDYYSKAVQLNLENIEDSRLRYVKQKKHINGAVARNVGIREAQGEFVAFIDDDDEWTPDKIKLQVELLAGNKNYGGVSSYYTYINSGRPIRNCTPYTNEDLHHKVLSREVSMYTSTIMFRKEALLKSGGFDESLIRHQDLQLFLDFLKTDDIIILKKHCTKIHVDVGGNRPNANNIIDIKEHFFEKMNHHFKMYDYKNRKKIYSAHYFEIIFVLIKEKRKLKSILKYLRLIGFSPKAYLNLFRRYYNRFKYKV